ncbi:hypothetical protein FLT15_06520 [Paenibacillus thiaminolyticus]|uniref:hypothetical protein n=1 Tax=Paenibacillus thiaminolyticus TaxID=49283 RepID=UPI0013F5B10E|nr:hypothetical protein [Paenibacillus thiaminolyticus]NGP58056.1 hypothetical protein [Paenibacillus thiaminolyticus]
MFIFFLLDVNAPFFLLESLALFAGTYRPLFLPRFRAPASALHETADDIPCRSISLARILANRFGLTGRLQAVSVPTPD